MKWKSWTSLLLTIAIIFSSFLIFPKQAQAAQIYDVFDASLYTDNKELARRIDAFFEEYPGTYPYLSNSGSEPCGGTDCKVFVVSAKDANGVVQYYSGSQCFALALLFSSKVFGIYCGATTVNGADDGNSYKYLTNALEVSYEDFVNCNISTGAHIRTISYYENKDHGHSLIVLKYDSEGIYTLEGNAYSDCSIHIKYYTWEQLNREVLAGNQAGPRKIVNVYMPKNIPTASVLGDLDESGGMDDWDMVLLARYLANWNVEITQELADADGNGVIDDWDEILFARKLAGWQVTLADGQ